MSRLPDVSSEDIIKVLKKEGFTYAPKRGRGSHQAFYKTNELGETPRYCPKRNTSFNTKTGQYLKRTLY